MTNQELLGEFLELPSEAQTEVLRLIAFLKQKHQQEEVSSALPNADLKNDLFLGMWRDRENLENSRTWVQNLRFKELDYPHINGLGMILQPPLNHHHVLHT